MKRATNVVLVLLLAMGVTILMTARTIAITARTPITTHIGFANTSCGSWTQARANHRSTHMEFWVIGFMSGVNYARSDEGFDMLKGKDAEALWSWIDNYCRSQPLEILPIAVAYLAIELNNARAH